MTTADDRLPRRLHEPFLKGPLSDKRLSDEEVRSIVQDYYRQQGWHTESGAPLLGTLQALDIADYATYAQAAVDSSIATSGLPPVVTLGAAAPEERHSE
jgi:hypothetical protein